MGKQLSDKRVGLGKLSSHGFAREDEQKGIRYLGRISQPNKKKPPAMICQDITEQKGTLCLLAQTRLPSLFSPYYPGLWNRHTHKTEGKTSPTACGSPLLLFPPLPSSATSLSPLSTKNCCPQQSMPTTVFPNQPRGKQMDSHNHNLLFAYICIILTMQPRKGCKHISSAQTQLLGMVYHTVY